MRPPKISNIPNTLREEVGFLIPKAVRDTIHLSFSPLKASTPKSKKMTPATIRKMKGANRENESSIGNGFNMLLV